MIKVLQPLAACGGRFELISLVEGKPRSSLAVWRATNWNNFRRIVQRRPRELKRVEAIASNSTVAVVELEFAVFRN